MIVPQNLKKFEILIFILQIILNEPLETVFFTRKSCNVKKVRLLALNKLL